MLSKSKVFNVTLCCLFPLSCTSYFQPKFETADGRFAIRSDCPGAQAEGEEKLFKDSAHSVTTMPDNTPSSSHVGYSFTLENASKYGFPNPEFFAKNHTSTIVYSENETVSCRAVSVDTSFDHATFTCERQKSQDFVCVIDLSRIK